MFSLAHEFGTNKCATCMSFIKQFNILLFIFYKLVTREVQKIDTNFMLTEK